MQSPGWQRWHKRLSTSQGHVGPWPSCFEEPNTSDVWCFILVWFWLLVFIFQQERGSGFLSFSGCHVSQPFKPEVWNNNYLDTTFPTLAPAGDFGLRRAGSVRQFMRASAAKAATAMKNSWAVHQPPSCGALCWEMQMNSPSIKCF